MDKGLESILAEVAKKRVAMMQTQSAENGKTKPAAGIDLDAERKARANLEKAGIYRRFQGITFDAIEHKGLPPIASIRKNYNEAKEYAEHLDENRQKGFGLILSGTYGTMKTTIAVAVLRKWLDDGNYGLLVPMCSLIDNLYTMRALNKEEWARYEARIRSTPLLVLDDLGGENTDQSWVLAKVDSIITERYNKMLPIIITTNLSKDELMGTYSGRIVDRLRNTSKYLVFHGASQRQARV